MRPLFPHGLRRFASAVVAATLFSSISCVALRAQKPTSATDLIAATLKNEDFEAAHKGRYEYTSRERSDRTGGHLWTERIAETDIGKLRMLVAVDGQPLSAAATSTERARLNQIVHDPATFGGSEQAKRDDEAHALKLLNLLPQAFRFSNAKPEGPFVRIDFQPNPSYSPQSIEERVLHAMSGSMLIDPQASRLHELQARLPVDVEIGFGILASIHAGSSFSTVRGPVPGNEWKTAILDTDVSGRAILLKSIARKEHVEHSDFIPIQPHMTVAQAVELLER